MTKNETASTQNLTTDQEKALETLKTMAQGNDDGRVSEYQARFGGVNMHKLKALVRRGLISQTYGEFLMPTGPLAGQTILTEAFYTITDNR
jgi:hypothetical protein